MNNRILRCLIAGVGMVCTAPMTAQVIVTDRPDQTESAAIVPVGSIQYEGGVLVEWEDFEVERQWMTPTSLVRLPVHERVELRLVHNRMVAEPIEGLDWSEANTALELGVKYNLLNGENGHMLAVLSHLQLPTLPGAGGAPSTHKLCLSHDVGPHWALGYNVGIALDDGFNGVMYTFAVGRSLGRGLSVYAEPYGTWTDDGGHVASFDAGLTWISADWIQWDWSFAKGLNHEYGYQSLGVSVLLGSNR